MDFVLKPALQHIALAKINIEFWIQNDYLMFKNEFKDELEAKVFIQVQNLSLPNLLKEELEHFIKPIGLQIFDWFEYLYKYYQIIKINPKEVCWTPYGIINKAKSAKVLLTDKSLAIEMRFGLACGHCLVDEIESLWKEMSEEEKLQQEKRYKSNNSGDHSQVQQYWTSFLISMRSRIGKDDQQNLPSNFYGCHRAMLSYNLTATQYFFGKLSFAEKESLLFNLRYVLRHCHSHTTETVRFLFSQMDKIQRAGILATFPISVLASFLDWPYQHFFLETAKQAWEYLDISDFKNLLIRITAKMVACGCEYRTILLQFWKSSPDKLKRCVTALDISPWQHFIDFLEKGEDVFKKNLEEGSWQLLIGDITVILTIGVNSAFKTEAFSIVHRKNSDRQNYSRSI